MREVPPLSAVKVTGNKSDTATSPIVAIETTPIATTTAEAAPLASSDSTQTQVGFEKAAEGSPAAGSSSVARNVGGRAAKTPALEAVVPQLCRVIAGCSQLLVLKGIIGEREEQALRAMSNRGSPVLLAAVEAYGVNQDLEVRRWCPLFRGLRAVLCLGFCCSVCVESLWF